jgi:nucleotide-binding universal stress UspA family protein
MYQRILVAVDGSSTAECALNEAMKLARDGGSVLLLLHVNEEPVMLTLEDNWVLPQELLDQLEENGRKILARAQEKVTAAGIASETRQVNDASQRIGAVIAEEADDWKAEVIVLGTHGRKGVDRLLLGSVAEDVARLAAMPVLLVRENK